jgi:hypothetical protein
VRLGIKDLRKRRAVTEGPQELDAGWCGRIARRGGESRSRATHGAMWAAYGRRG